MCLVYSQLYIYEEKLTQEGIILMFYSIGYFLMHLKFLDFSVEQLKKKFIVWFGANHVALAADKLK